MSVTFPLPLFLSSGGRREGAAEGVGDRRRGKGAALAGAGTPWEGGGDQTDPSDPTDRSDGRGRSDQSDQSDGSDQSDQSDQSDPPDPSDQPVSLRMSRVWGAGYFSNWASKAVFPAGKVKMSQRSPASALTRSPPALTVLAFQPPARAM